MVDHKDTEICPECGGSGEIPGYNAHGNIGAAACGLCGGTGEVENLNSSAEIPPLDPDQHDPPLSNSSTTKLDTSSSSDDDDSEVIDEYVDGYQEDYRE